MAHSSCCVVNCKNTGRNSKVKFYRFPNAPWNVEQRQKWIAAVNRINADGSPWCPKPSNLICSDHFIGGKKSDITASPSYIPKIFPPIYHAKTVNESAAISRYKRFMERRKKIEVSTTIPTVTTIELPETYFNVEVTLKVDQECQTDIPFKSNNTGNTFVCNRYISSHVCDAEIQTEIYKSITFIQNNGVMGKKSCSGPRKLGFNGHSSIRGIGLSGSNYKKFKLFLKSIRTKHNQTVLPKNIVI